MPDNTQQLRVLVVDDEDGIRHAAQRWLAKEKYRVKTMADGQSALTELLGTSYDMVISDVRMPGIGGFELLDAIRERQLAPVVILMSAYGDKEATLDAIRRGAYDFIAKPFTRAELLLVVRKAQERESLRRENRVLRRALESESNTFGNMVARSDGMRRIFETVRKVAEYRSTVLLQGESGTGKELVARALHFQSPRADKPFVPVNCGAIPETLLESELFGHVKGAFTDATRLKRGLFEEADSGTLFLDEIASLPLGLQVKLLRVLQESEIRRVGDTRNVVVDVRVVAACADDLAEMVERGEFREDLFYRLNVIPIQIPPLRERREDIPLLAEHFLAEFGERLGRTIRAFESDATEALSNYHWPGNVRELQNLVEQMIVLADGDVVTRDALPPRIRDAAGQGPRLSRVVQNEISDDDLSVKKATRALERELIRRALVKTGGNRTHAAKLLELSHRALLYKIKDYELRDVK